MRVPLFSHPILIFHPALQIQKTPAAMMKSLGGNRSQLKSPGGMWNGGRTLSCCSVSLSRRPAVAFLISRRRTGVFLANFDSAIILAFFRQIASYFDHLSSASWIINVYLLGLVVAQPLVYSSSAWLEGQQNL